MQSGCIWAKVVVFVQMLFYSSKVVVIGKRDYILAKVVVFWQKRLYSDISGCIRGKLVVFGQKWLY